MEISSMQVGNGGENLYLKLSQHSVKVIFESVVSIILLLLKTI